MDETMPDDIIELKASAPAIVTQARTIAAALKTPEDITTAYAWIADRKREMDFVIAKLAPAKKKASEALEEIRALEREAANPRKDGIAIVKAAIGAAEMERERQDRIQREKALAEQAKRDEDERLKRAAKLEKQGHSTLADAELAQAGNFVPIVPEIEKPKGGYVRKVWCAEVVNKREFINWVNSRGNMEGEDKALIPNEAWLCDKAKMTDGNAKVPGVRFFEKPHVALAPQRRTA